MPSKIWSISSDSYLAVPLNSRCSSRCDSPASARRLSPREPVPIQKPSDTDRTEGIASVTIRTPESSVVRRCSLRHGVGALGPRALGVAIAHAATIAVTVAVAAVAAVRGHRGHGRRGPRSRSRGRRGHGRAVAASPAPTARELLRGLARDLRVVGEPQADPAALAVDLDDPDVELVALVEDLLDRRDRGRPGATLEMCSRPSVPLESSTKAPNVVVLTTLPVNSSPTSTSLVIERIRSTSASPRSPLAA